MWPYFVSICPTIRLFPFFAFPGRCSCAFGPANEGVPEFAVHRWAVPGMAPRCPGCSPLVWWCFIDYPRRFSIFSVFSGIPPKSSGFRASFLVNLLVEFSGVYLLYLRYQHPRYVGGTKNLRQIMFCGFFFFRRTIESRREQNCIHFSRFFVKLFRDFP